MIIEKALEQLKQYNLPSKGLLAGGSLANLLWSEKCGREIPINDIDIFTIDSIKNELSSKYEKWTWDSNGTQTEIHEYHGVVYRTKRNKFYSINKVERDGIFNYISCESSINDYQLIIDSFDINCCQIGYDLETGKIYTTPDFQEFLETGELKITSPNSPCHTAMRLLKKRDELGAKLNIEEEFNILTTVLNNRSNDIVRIYFGDKYYQVYLQYSNELLNWFQIDRSGKQKWDHNLNKIVEVPYQYYTLRPLKSCVNVWTSNLKNLIYYFRNIHNNELNNKLWSVFGELVMNDRFLDGFGTIDKIHLNSLVSFMKDDRLKYNYNSNRWVHTLKNYSLKEIVEIYRMLYNYKDDFVKLKVLFDHIDSDKVKFEDIDEEFLFYLELNKRVKIMAINRRLNDKKIVY